MKLTLYLIMISNLPPRPVKFATTNTTVIALSVAFVLSLVTSRASAEANETSTLAANNIGAPSPDGLVTSHKLGGTFNFSDNRDVIGQTDGLTMTLGYKLSSIIAYTAKAHEWRNGIYLAQSLARTPSIDAFLKAQDELRVESLYLFHLLDWLGPYLRFAADSPVFRAYDERESVTQYRVTYLDGKSEDTSRKVLPLTDMFHPLRLRQSAGPFARALNKPAIKLELRLGGAAQEIFAHKQLAIQDNKDTEEVEVTELENLQQVGAEFVTVASGKLGGDHLSYKLEGELMLPLYHSASTTPDDRTVLDLANLDLRGTLSVKLASFASLDYELKLSRQPQLIKDTQIQNHLLLNFGVESTQPPAKEKK